MFADWLDEKHPETPVELDQLPKGFNTYWHTHGLGRTLGQNALRAGHGKWANWEIFSAFQNLDFGDDPWFDHAGAATIAGYPVLVSEPYLSEASALAVCREFQRVAGAPVTFSRRAAWHESCVRIGLWFTAMPSREQLLVETADQLHRASREERRRRESS